ncbi:MAG: Adenylate kinase [Candidatus Nomurabacteria bacterium GW2011_GWC2_42_20]|uniref:Adenylate kinase n=1 Tax=Candidatus Nomurabacteria bacterium GW2011_GWC2_42_20 TaxID=1618756 RepID=A0A0G1CF28_9BACT|nr:MAG: Adenylate kinase [Candidatus Nomurabacteria bacterium GW2011_GWC2_42_20]TAN37153.1 MAG: hypothetical protein EPN27_00200 [Patescibacteria group bacterium]
MELQTVIFIGRSGAGKGMQSGMLQKFLTEKTPENPILYIETGDHFRRHIKDSGYTWELARKVNDLGGRQPDFLAVWIWSHLFIEKIRGGEHIVFDGMPRSIIEANILDTALPFYERKNPTVIFLNVSQEWAEERLRGRGRADDISDEVVARRLAFFTKDVVPAIDHYRSDSSYRFLEINGEQTPDEVFNDIKNGLDL